MDGSDRQNLLACIGDQSRFRLAMRLAFGPGHVSELASDIGLSQSCTTRHLQAMERAGLLDRQRDGKRVVYRLKREERVIASILEWIQEAPAARSADLLAERAAGVEDAGRRDAGRARAVTSSRPGPREAPSASDPSPVKPRPELFEEREETQESPAERRPLPRDDMEDYLL